MILKVLFFIALFPFSLAFLAGVNYGRSERCPHCGRVSA